VTATEFSFTAPVWLYEGKAAWHFVTLPEDVADEIAEQADSRGFGSVRVRARIGATTWATSLFPDKKAASYLLPVKASVRQAEGIRAGQDLTIHVALA
jgi:Domain of unknown function (DUF1905)